MAASNKSTMITINLPSRRKTKVYQIQHRSVSTGPKESPKLDEEDKAATDAAVKTWIMRDNIVKAHAAKCPFRPGDRVYPATQEAYDQFGECIVERICKDYKEYTSGRSTKNTDWPADDNPRLVMVRIVKQNNSFAYVPVNWIGSVVPANTTTNT